MSNLRERLLAWADYFGAVALALWAAAIILFFIGNQPRERLLALVGVGVLFFIVFVVAKFSNVRAAVTSRSARYGSNTLLVTILFLGIVGLVNFLGIRYPYRYDTTANQTFTLSPLTVQAVQGIKEPVNVLAFYSFSQSSSTTRQELDDRMKDYRNLNPDKINYKMIDLDADPQLAYDYNVQLDGTIVFERGKRRENVFGTDEQSLTNALLKVASDTQPTLYFTTGHGEHSLDDSNQNGYSFLRDGLQLNNYKAATIDLKTITDTIPSDATAVVIAGPQSPFDPNEVKPLKDYLDQGGRLLVMLDPGTTTGLDDLLKSYGVVVHNDLVYDQKFGAFGRQQVPVINSYKSSPVTQNLTGQSTFFPGVRSLAGNSSVVSYTVSSLFSSSDLSWGETDLESVKNQTAKQDDKDLKGPLDLAYTIEGRGDKPMRIVVIGNSTFLSNANLQVRGQTSSGQQVDFGNGLLFLNVARWFAGQENLITIPPKPSGQHPLSLTAEQMNFVMISSFALLPGVILIIGALVWWGRR